MRSKFKKLIIAVGYTAYKIVRIPLKWYWKIFKIHTQGVRVLVVYQNKIILVRHWYNSLWVMPGGGIKKYETPEQAAVREVKEELGINIHQLEYLLGIYSNIKEGKNDVVHCFVVQLNTQLDISLKKFNLEISDRTWFELENLPTGTSRATRDRIREYKTKEISNTLRSW